MEYFICNTLRAVLKKETCLNIRKGKKDNAFGHISPQQYEEVVTNSCKNCNQYEKFHKNEFNLQQILIGEHRNYLEQIASEILIKPKVPIHNSRNAGLIDSL